MKKLVPFLVVILATVAALVIGGYRFYDANVKNDFQDCYAAEIKLPDREQPGMMRVQPIVCPQTTLPADPAGIMPPGTSGYKG